VIPCSSRSVTIKALSHCSSKHSTVVGHMSVDSVKYEQICFIIVQEHLQALNDLHLNSKVRDKKIFYSFAFANTQSLPTEYEGLRSIRLHPFSFVYIPSKYLPSSGTVSINDRSAISLVGGIGQMFSPATSDHVNFSIRM